MRSWMRKLLLGKAGQGQKSRSRSTGDEPDQAARTGEESSQAKAADVQQDSGLRKALDRAGKELFHGEEAVMDCAGMVHEEEMDEQVRKLITSDISEMSKFGASFDRFRKLNDPNASMADIAETVGMDPVFSARVLAVANSPYFSVVEQVTSVHHAVMVLGLVNLKTLYFREYFRMLGSGDGRVKHVRQDIWAHLALAAVCSSHVAEAVAGVEPETAYTIGLLHDVGKFPVLNLPLSVSESRELFTLLRGAGYLAREDELAGVNHAMVGRMACEVWKFPDLVTRTISRHHLYDPSQDGECGVDNGSKGEELPYLACLWVANGVARMVVDDEPEEFEIAPLPPGLAGYVDRKRIKKILAGDALYMDVAKTGAIFSSEG